MKRFECVDAQKAAGFPVTSACEAAAVSNAEDRLSRPIRVPGHVIVLGSGHLKVLALGF